MTRPAPWKLSEIPTLWLDVETGAGVDDAGAPIRPILGGRRQKPALVDLFNTAEHHRAARIMLSGKFPAVSGHENALVAGRPPKGGGRLGITSRTTVRRPAGSSRPRRGTRWRSGSPGNGSAPTRSHPASAREAMQLLGSVLAQSTTGAFGGVTDRDRAKHLGLRPAERLRPARPRPGPGRADPPHLRSAPHRTFGGGPVPLRLRRLPAPDPGQNRDPRFRLRRWPVHVLRAVPRGGGRRPPPHPSPSPRVGGRLLCPGPVPGQVHRPRLVGNPRHPARVPGRHRAVALPQRAGRQLRNLGGCGRAVHRPDLVGERLLPDFGWDRVRPGPAVGHVRLPDPESTGERGRPGCRRRI